ncbi:hypothetical protein BS47DRAFT_1367015 [Hydnum rufescens UP504]|uniref:Uncharacterized protein n=1 Tax=Hydnum rufescens UP504 TaxID=1448309 RepID=A0A9P6AJD8_9AGAM|nr:hypothetical protein BS47DRAFT_1367015 [Hydnum rufescens UP504]
MCAVLVAPALGRFLSIGNCGVDFASSFSSPQPQQRTARKGKRATTHPPQRVCGHKAWGLRHNENPRNEGPNGNAPNEDAPNDATYGNAPTTRHTARHQRRDIRHHATMQHTPH